MNMGGLEVTLLVVDGPGIVVVKNQLQRGTQSGSMSSALVLRNSPSSLLENFSALSSSARRRSWLARRIKNLLDSPSFSALQTDSC